jgi:hypothetical protein
MKKQKQGDRARRSPKLSAEKSLPYRDSRHSFEFAQGQSPVDILGAKDSELAKFHPDLLADVAYLNLASKISVEQLELALPAALIFQKQMRPRDALERLALTQVLMAHARTAWLTKVLVNQADPSHLAVISEATERTASTFARLMRAITDYRQPRTSVSIGQANLAQQQIVQNKVAREKENSKRTNFEVCRRAAPVQVDARRAALSSGDRQANATLATEHRRKNPSRKKPLGNERDEARCAVSRGNRTTKDDERND